MFGEVLRKNPVALIKGQEEQKYAQKFMYIMLSQEHVLNKDPTGKGILDRSQPPGQAVKASRTERSACVPGQHIGTRQGQRDKQLSVYRP